MLVIMSAIFSSLAALTGICAIGSGRHWRFNIADYFRGKRNAILYLWVTASTIFSIVHAGALTDYGISNHWDFRTPDDVLWFILHATMGVLLTAAHIFVATTLSREVGPVDRYLWGRKRHAV